MNKFTPFVLICVVLLITSCVPRKDFIYLQNKDTSKNIQIINEVVYKPYRIQSDDVLMINIKASDPKWVAMFTVSGSSQSDQGAFVEGYNVDDHGNVRIPVLGELNVLGLTTDEIRLKVEKILLTDYFNKDANVFVSVKLAGFRYTINGEIGSPGTKVLFREKLNILEAIANSGDISMTGDRKDVVIMRQFSQGTEMHSIDLTDINVLKSPYYFLQPNDYVYVKPLKQKSWGTGTTGIQSLNSVMSVLTLVISTFLIFKTL
jgi:polysaccharide export outer membrane protein